MSMLKKIIKSLIGKNKGNVKYLHDGAYLPNWSDYVAVRDNSIFTLGVGRSGTHFMAALLGEDKRINAYHLDDIKDSVGDAFLFYSEHYNLPIDHFGLFASRNHLIKESVEANKIYLESNPYISFSVNPLHDEFGGKIIHMFRNPENVVNSHANKGWYNQIPGQRDFQKVLGYQYFMKRPNHFFGRITPADEDEYKRWIKLTRIGKIAWKWNIMNLRILDQLKSVDSSFYRSIYLDEFNYDAYKDVHEFVGGHEPISETRFLEITKSKPGKGKITRSVQEWTELEREEFEMETFEARKQLGLV